MTYPAHREPIDFRGSGAERLVKYPDGLQAVFVEQHRAIAATSVAGEQRTIPGAAHLMQWNKPEVVVAAIREVVTRYRNGG